jgi:hypothetical protein
MLRIEMLHEHEGHAVSRTPPIPAEAPILATGKFLGSIWLWGKAARPLRVEK